MGGGRHADPATGAFGGVPYEAKNRVMGVPMCGGVRNAEENDWSDNESPRAGEYEHEWV